jgi:ankyrin repeat protein
MPGIKPMFKQGALGGECSNHSIPTIFFNDFARFENDRAFSLCTRHGALRASNPLGFGGHSGDLKVKDLYTPGNTLVINGHFKTVKYFTDNYNMFELDMNAKNNEGHTARNLAILHGHHDIAEQLLIREINNCISAARIWHEMSAGWTWMLPRRND